MPETPRAHPLGFLLFIFVISLPAGYLVLKIIEEAITWLWFIVPSELSGPALWALVLGVPMIAGLLVAWIRSHGDDGHNPMFGIALEPINSRAYPSIITAIVVSLAGGLVIGPEAAMVCTGAVIGTSIAKRAGIDIPKGAAIGAGGALVALFVGPVLDGDFTVAPHYQFQWAHLVGAIGTSVATAVVLALGRFLSIGILHLRKGDRPKLLQLAIAGLLVGAVALVYQLCTGNSVNLVLTSGESNVKQMLELGTTSAIAITIAAKWLAYSITMGGGFRGGPFFPAIYIGAGIGAIATLLFPDYTQGSVVAGLAASVIYLAHPKWAVTLAISIVLGLIGGGPELIPLTVAASAVAKLMHEVKVANKVTGGGKSRKSDNPL